MGQPIDITKEQEAELDRKYPEGYIVVPTPEGCMAFQRPSIADFERFTDKMARDRGESAAARELVLCCMVLPDLQAGQQILERLPGAILPITGAIRQLAGAQLEVRVKGL